MESEDPEMLKKSVEEEPEYRMAVARLQFFATQQRELFLNVGDRIVIYDSNANDWWNGRNLSTQEVGWFPANHVELSKRSVSAIRKTAHDYEWILLRWAKRRRDAGLKVDVEELRHKIGELGNNLLENFAKKYPTVFTKGNDPNISTEDIDKEQDMNLSSEFGLAEEFETKEEEGTKKNFSQSHLSDEQEKIILKWIDDQYAAGKPVTPNELRFQATELARKTDPSKNVFSSSWVTRFKRRHSHIVPKLKLKNTDPRGKSLDEEEEMQLAEWVKERNRMGNTPNRKEIVAKATEFIRKKDTKSPRISRKAIVNFHARHPELKMEVSTQFGSTYFNEEEEAEIVAWIQDRYKNQKSTSPTDVINHALKVAQTKKDPNKSTFTYDWFYGFRDRHPEIQVQVTKMPVKRKRDNESEEIGEEKGENISDSEGETEGEEKKKSAVIE